EQRVQAWAAASRAGIAEGTLHLIERLGAQLLEEGIGVAPLGGQDRRCTRVVEVYGQRDADQVPVRAPLRGGHALPDGVHAIDESPVRGRGIRASVLPRPYKVRCHSSGWRIAEHGAEVGV